MLPYGLGKVSKRIMAMRLAYYTETHYFLHVDQIGERLKHLAVDEVLTLAYNADLVCPNKTVVSALFIDVKGVFHNMVMTCLLEKL